MGDGEGDGKRDAGQGSGSSDWGDSNSGWLLPADDAWEAGEDETEVLACLLPLRLESADVAAACAVSPRQEPLHEHRLEVAEQTLQSRAAEALALAFSSFGSGMDAADGGAGAAVAEELQGLAATAREDIGSSKEAANPKFGVDVEPDVDGIAEARLFFSDAAADALVVGAATEALALEGRGSTPPPIVNSATEALSATRRLSQLDTGLEADVAESPTCDVRIRPSAMPAHGQGAFHEPSVCYPLLLEYAKQPASRRRHGRYFSSGGLHYSNDGHPVRELSRISCHLCFSFSHKMGCCPFSRCRVCFNTGHVAYECPDIFEGPVIAEALQTCADAALTAGGDIRCVACGLQGPGHANCSVPPPLPEMDDIETAEEVEKDEKNKELSQDGQERDQGVDGKDDEEEMEQEEEEVVDAFARWGEPVPAPGGVTVSGTGRTGGGLDVAVLRLLSQGTDPEGPWHQDLRNAPTDAVACAAHGLLQLGALVPGPSRGFAPHLTTLGWWLAPLPLPPAMSCVLLHSALWGVLLPAAAMVVLLDSAPPEIALQDVDMPPRKSGHYALAAAYFRWREGRETKLSQRFCSRLFWESVDSRVVAVCKHAQQMLGYDGDDAAFEVMDGELMDVRRRGSRPWTLASALGSETSPRWARFRAAICAAFPPQPGRGTGEWVAHEPIGEETSSLRTTVESNYAVLFAHAELKPVGDSHSEFEIAGVRGVMCGGEGAFEEAQALRQEYADRVSLALEGAGGELPRLTTMDDGIAYQVLRFLRDPAGEVVLTEQRSRQFIDAEALGTNCDLGVLSLLRGSAEKCRHGGNGTESAELPTVFRAPSGVAYGRLVPASSSSELAAGVFTHHSPRTSKHAFPTDDYAYVECRSISPGSEGKADTMSVVLSEWSAALVEIHLLRCLKGRAVAREDYRLASELKSHEAAVEQALAKGRESALVRYAPACEAALRRLAGRKRKAVEDEDFDLAARLKRREMKLEARPKPPSAGEIERVVAEKRKSVEAENFGRAAALKARQTQLEVEQRHFEEALTVCAADHATALANDRFGRNSLLNGSGGMARAAGADDAAWAEVVCELQKFGARHKGASS